MRRNPRLLADRPLDRAWRPLAAFTAIERRMTVVAIAIGVVLFAAAAMAVHFDSERRAVNIQAALTARGLGPAVIERVGRRVYTCKHAYVWRTARTNGSACTDSFSSRVAIYGPGQQPLVKCWRNSGGEGWRLRPCPSS